jgi:hypothetical protein
MNGVWQNQPTGSLRQVRATHTMTGSDDSKESPQLHRTHSGNPAVGKMGGLRELFTCSFAHFSRTNYNIDVKPGKIERFPELWR